MLTSMGNVGHVTLTSLLDIWTAPISPPTIERGWIVRSWLGARNHRSSGEDPKVLSQGRQGNFNIKGGSYFRFSNPFRTRVGIEGVDCSGTWRSVRTGGSNQ